MIDREDILRMAQAAGFKIKRFSSSDGGRFPVAQRSDGRWVGIGSELAQFATLVAAAEREACAKACEQDSDSPEAKDCASTIRARRNA